MPTFVASACCDNPRYSRHARMGWTPSAIGQATSAGTHSVFGVAQHPLRVLDVELIDDALPLGPRQDDVARLALVLDDHRLNHRRLSDDRVA